MAPEIEKTVSQDQCQKARGDDDTITRLEKSIGPPSVAATLAVSIAAGGSVTLRYGIVLIFILGTACALTMAEIASVYPTSGGQYHYTNILAPRRYSRVLSYICGLLNVFGWIVLAAGFTITIPQMITALVMYWDPAYDPRRWLMFLMYQAVNLFFAAYNILLLKRTAWLYDVGCPTPKQPNQLVWSAFINTTGWASDGIDFLTGLLNANFIYSGLDGAIHIAEDCINPAVAVPWALLSTVTIGGATAFVFAVAMTYSYHNFDAVLASPFPIFELWQQALSSPAAATAFLLILMLCGSFGVLGALQTASRLTWCFAPDDALVGSHLLRRIIHPHPHPHPHSRLAGVPVWALSANCAVVALGCLGFAIPAALVLRYRLRGREAVDRVLLSSSSSKFRLPSAVGWVANTLTVVHGLVALVFYSLPAQLPATGSNMNYAYAVLGIIALFAAGNWIWYARTRYQGPRLDGQ
ncbi:uncharacterized protein B0T15DRAFT_496366 [Chaetomium strumarium]|uniref:Uncharacterized protein n=1 Tax=Chaetomium strumarium TaxID=1170767 RepID=A0AAJ0GQ32_9PEZI|nr:hypothetical protein B0T15DRAFT_496366 [Chaetomium strumarium]